MIKKKKKKKLLIFIKRSIKIGQRKKDKRNLKINFPDYKPLFTLHIIIQLVVQERQLDEKEEPKEISTVSPVVTGAQPTRI